MIEPRLPHGYTNESWVCGNVVFKRYRGPDAGERVRTEVRALEAASGAVPVPAVVEVSEDVPQAAFQFVNGRHGQELIDEGYAPEVLRAAGRTLRGLNDGVPGLIHGDYGPQNLLLDQGSLEVTAVLDWEFSHLGEPVEDIAWAEWIVRMHHPGASQHLGALFDGYGQELDWILRHAAMQAKCTSLQQISVSRGDEAAADLWTLRAQITRSWRRPSTRPRSH